MPLLDLSDRYLKRCHRDDNRDEKQISLKKYRKKRFSESEDEKYERKKYKKSSRRDNDGRHKMIELSNQCKEKEYRSSDKIRRSIKKERSRSCDRYHRKSRKIDEKHGKSPKKSKSLKWEEELYGEKDKKVKYELLHSGKLSNKIDFNLEKLINDTKSTKIYKKSIFDNQNNLIKRNNEININFPKAFLDKNEINNFYNDLKLDKLIYDNLIKNNFDKNISESIDNHKNVNSKNVILNNENYLEKLNIQSLNNVTSDKVMIVIDYEHSDKTVDAKIIYNKINEENEIKSTENCVETHDFVAESVSAETSNVEIKSSSNDDIMALANLIVNASQTINIGGNSAATIIKNKWKLIKLDIPIQINYAASSIDISKCFKNDPRLERLRD